MKNKRVDFIITQEVIEEVGHLIEAYKKQVRTGNVDYYELFQVSPAQTAETLKKSVNIQRLEFILQTRNAPIYGLDAVGLADYARLVSALSDFKVRVLANESSKKTYDRELAELKRAKGYEEAKNDFAYVPEIHNVEFNTQLTTVEHALYKALEACTVIQGSSQTILTVSKLMVDKDKNALPEEVKPIFASLPLGAVETELVKKHGNKDIVTIISEEMDEMLSRKSSILTDALTLTANNYNKQQAELALKMLITQGLPLAFHRYKDASRGRDKVTMEIKPKFAKYVVAAYLQEDVDLRAMEDPAKMATMYMTDEEIEDIVTIMLPKKKLFGGFGK